MHDPSPRRGDVASRIDAAVWTLLLPAAGRVLCLGEPPPVLIREMRGRGARVDLVAAGADSRSLPWRAEVSGAHRAASGREATVPERLPAIDREVAYDLALLWDPASRGDLGAWLDLVAGLRRPPAEIAVWGRNPWSRHRQRAAPRAPSWPSVDRTLRRGGLFLGEVLLGLPGPERLRQVVEWRAYTRTSLVEHRRTHRRWKAWVTRRAPYRWFLPVRLQRAVARGVTPRSTILAALIDRAGRDLDRSARLERLLVSPNGVAIAALRLEGQGAVQNAILKVPYVAAAERRVARNAEALHWLAAHSALLGRWGRAAPRLLGQSRAGAWSCSLEECAAGGSAQDWGERAADAVRPALAEFLSTLARLGETPRNLDRETLERLCGAPLRAAAALLEPRLARRLHDLGEHVLQTLADVHLPLVPRHGDFKLENVLGEPSEPDAWRVLDWELWDERGLPLLDLWHLIVSRRQRRAGCSLGEAVRRWLLPRDLSAAETALVAQLGSGLDRRYVDLSPWLYWLDRIGPQAERGAWPAPGWQEENVVQVLAAFEPLATARGRDSGVQEVQRWTSRGT